MAETLDSLRELMFHKLLYNNGRCDDVTRIEALLFEMLNYRTFCFD